jgi:outer membrane protein, heavy metal efflux system
MKTAILFVFLCLSALVARAQSPFAGYATMLENHLQDEQASGPALTLAQLEQEALHANPEIRLAVRQLSTAQARVPAAGALDDPMFMYRGWGVPLRQPWDFNQAQNMFMLSQTFAGPGKRGLRSSVAEQDVSIARAMLESKRLEVLSKVRKAYNDLLLNREQLRIHDEQAGIARQGLEAARIRYSAGNVPQQDVLKAQIALSRLVEHLVMLRQTGQLARATLNQLIGNDPAAPLQVTGEYHIPAKLPNLSELEDLAIASRPELRASATTIDQSESALKLARKAYTPDYTVSGGYMLMPGTAAVRNTYMTEFSLNLPWLNRGRHDSEIAEAQAKRDTAQSEYELQRSVVFQQIQEALVRAQAARDLLELYGNTLRPQAESTLRATVAAYENNRTDFLNLLDSQNAIIEIETSYAQAASEFQARQVDLELAVGASLPTDAQPATKERVR